MTSDEKLRAALDFLGTKHVLHKDYSGKHTFKPDAEVSVTKTIKRVSKEAAAEARRVEVERLERIARTVTPFRVR